MFLEENTPKIQYSAVILDQNDGNTLFNIIKKKFKLDDNWIKKCHHATLDYGKHIKDTKNSKYEGEEVNLKIIKIASDKKVIAVMVDVVKGPKVKTSNEIFHITVAVNKKNNGSPKDSNNLKNWKEYSGLFVKGKVGTVEIINGKEKINYGLYRKRMNLAADIICTRTTKNGNEILLIKRKDGSWALPGGFVDQQNKNAKYFLQDNEIALDAAVRELSEETGLNIDKSKLIYVGRFGDSQNSTNRDPRNTKHKWVVTKVYKIHLEFSEKNDNINANDDAQDVKWISFEKLINMINSNQLAFDHAEIIKYSKILFDHEISNKSNKEEDLTIAHYILNDFIRFATTYIKNKYKDVKSDIDFKNKLNQYTKLLQGLEVKVKINENTYYENEKFNDFIKNITDVYFNKKLYIKIYPFASTKNMPNYNRSKIDKISKKIYELINTFNKEFIKSNKEVLQKYSINKNKLPN